MPQDPAALQKKLATIRRESEERSAQRLARELGLPYLDTRKTPTSLEAVKLVPAEKAREAGVVTVELKTKKVALAAVNPKSKLAQAVVKELEAGGYEVNIFVASSDGVQEAQRLYAHITPEAAQITGKVQLEEKSLQEFIDRFTSLESVSRALEATDFKQTDTTHLFAMILAGGLRNRASDIHFEAEEKKVRLRYRIDGILHDVYDKLPPHNYDALISRIKLLSGLKINVRDEAQDGRFTIALPRKEIEMRVSAIPSEFGETIVMRILDPDSINIGLTTLGLREDDLEIVKREIARPNGLILNTGPTGSGKTTTLYSFLRSINKPEVKVITIEDPIEYHLEGIEQTQVDPGQNYTFANGLRSVLRQDPNIILVGEIRDGETADIALQAALTGHLVFSTLHTNDAIGAVPRLHSLGVKPSTIGPALTLVIAQRLVRRLCNDCKKKAAISEELRSRIKKFLDDLPPRVDKQTHKEITIYEPGGCAACDHIGYHGRIAVFELLVMGEEFEETILKEVSEVTMRKIAEKEQMITMQQDGILKVISGTTTLREVENATGPIVWQGSGSTLQK